MASKAEAARLNGKRGGRPRKDATAKPTKTHDVRKTQETQEPKATAAAIENPFKLTPRELLFVEAYCGVAQFSPSKAYEIAGYKPNDGNASNLTRRYRVAQAIATRLGSRAQQLRIMGGDEALERLTLHARADIGNLLGPDDPIAKLAPDVRATIKAIRPNAHGRTIELYDAQRATELLAKAAGKLRDVHIVATSLEDLLAGVNAAQQAQVPA